MQRALEAFKNPRDQFAIRREILNEVINAGESPRRSDFGARPYWFVIEQAPSKRLFRRAARSEEGYLFMPLTSNRIALLRPHNHRALDLGWPDVGQILEPIIDGTGYTAPLIVLGVNLPHGRRNSATCIVEVNFL